MVSSSTMSPMILGRISRSLETVELYSYFMVGWHASSIQASVTKALVHKRVSIGHSKIRNLDNSIPIKQLTKRMSEIESLLDKVQLANILGMDGVRIPQVRVLLGTFKHIWQESRGISLLHSSGQSNAPLDVEEAISQSGMSVRKLSCILP